MQQMLFLDPTDSDPTEHTRDKKHVEVLKMGLMQDGARVEAHLVAVVKGKAWRPFKSMSVNAKLS